MPGPTTWMPVYTRDLISSCADMTPAQFGAYVRLLCYCWDNNGAPNDMEACLRIAGGVSPNDWKVIRRRLIVLDEGTSEERLSQKRLEEERATCLTKYNKKLDAIRKAREANPNNGTVNRTDHSTDNRTDHSTDHCHQSQSQSHSLKREDDSPTENLGATRKARRPRTYRIVWSADAGFTGITDEDRGAWATAYPGVNLTGELAKAHVYLRENPSKAGKRNWGAFLARWFGRVQDKGGSTAGQPAAVSGWSSKKYYRARFGTSMTDAEYDAALKGQGGPRKPSRPAGGVSTLSDVIAPHIASQEVLNEDYPD